MKGREDLGDSIAKSVPPLLQTLLRRIKAMLTFGMLTAQIRKLFGMEAQGEVCSSMLSASSHTMKCPGLTQRVVV